MQFLATASLLTAMTPVLAGPSASMPDEPVPAAQASVPMNAPAGPLLCGLDPAAVDGIVAHYELAPDMAAVFQALHPNFDCSAYGSLCAETTPHDAQIYVCSVWHDLAVHASPEFVLDHANVALDSILYPRCEPDWQECASICSPDPVRWCDAVLHDAECYSIAMCDFFSRIPTLYELGLPFFEVILDGVQIYW